MTKNNHPKIALSSKLVTLLILGITLFLGGAQFVLANTFSTKGEEIHLLEKKKETLTKEILHLENELAEKTSLLAIQKEAEDLGMVEVGNQIEYLTPYSLATKE